MGGFNFFDYIYEWVWVFCESLKHIYGWVYLSRRHLFMSVTIYEWLSVDVAVLNTFADMCTFLEYFHLWLGVTECGWVGKMVQPIYIALFKVNPSTTKTSHMWNNHLIFFFWFFIIDIF